MDKQNVIIIAGMHRSGTSLTANLLMKSGLFIGEKLMHYGGKNNGHGFDNKKGHFEDLEFLDLHQNDLNRKNIDNRGLRHIPEQPLNFDKISSKMIGQLLKRRNHLKLWGWKEPRTTLYLQDWKNYIPEVKIIGIYRNYDEVVNSIIKRYMKKIKYGVGINKIRRVLHLLIFPVNFFLIKYQAYRAWYIYNSHILEFKSKYPNDIVILDLNYLVVNYNFILTELNHQFNLELTPIDHKSIFDESLLSHKKEKNKFRGFSYKKLNRVT